MLAGLPPPNNQLLWEHGASSSAACAAAMPAPVSLSESEPEDDVLAVIADSFTAPQLTENSSEAALSNTLTVLSRAGVHSANISIDAFVGQLKEDCHYNERPSRSRS